MPETLLVVGASVRALAASAMRAGYAPVAADLFADRDLKALCPARRVADYPRGLLALPEWDQAGPWMYTGALENHPDLIDDLARRRLLWGNCGAIVRPVRSPPEVARVLRLAGLPHPTVWAGTEPPPAEGKWIVKPLASAGGAGVRLWTGGPVPRRPHVFQEYVEGLLCSAVYVGNGKTALLFGATGQFVVAPFRYGGNVGPLPLDASLKRRFEDLGNVLAYSFELRGPFGVDAVLRDGAPWPIEVNPRYTASVEVLERALGCSIFDPLHGTEPSGRVVAKAVFYAPAPLVFPEEAPPDCADIPEAGERIEVGRPVFTYFASESSIEACVEALGRRHKDLVRLLYGG